MAGVAGPMLRGNRRAAAARLLAGLLAGEVAAAVLLAIPAFLLGVGLRAAFPQFARLWALAALCLLFGVADLVNRTPRVRRQVPEMLLERLPPGTLGLAWGFDLGLLFTTQKAVSLIWAAIAAAILLNPEVAAGMLILIAVLGSMTVIVLSIGRRPGIDRLSHRVARLRHARQGSGALLIGLFLLTAVQAWRG